MKILISFFFSLLTFCISAQISIIPPPLVEKEIYIRDVSNILILNHQKTLIQGYLVVSITKIGSNENIKITTGLYSFQSGSNRVNIANNIKSIDFSSNVFAGFGQSIKSLPYSNYNICFTVIGIVENVIIAEECDNIRSIPLIPVTNESPADNARVEECGFMLMWSPPVPFQDNITYNLKIVEQSNLYDKGNLAALVNSNPKVLRNGIRTNSFFLANNVGLVGGKTYIWQVSAMQNGQIISQSKPSSFLFLCEKEINNLLTEKVGTFWGINSNTGNSKYFLTENILRIKYDHYSNDEKVKCEIRKIDVSPSLQIFEGYFDVNYGLNLIEHPMESLEGGVYQMVLKDYSGNKFLLDYIVQK